MNKQEVDEHEQWSEKVRSQRFCPPLLDKNMCFIKHVLCITLTMLLQFFVFPSDNMYVYNTCM